MSSNIYANIARRFGLSPTQLKIVELVGSGKEILEIGSATGYMTKKFIKNRCIVDIVEIDETAAAKIKQPARKVIRDSIENPAVFKKLNKSYDFIIMADVLEHLINPEQVLRRLLMIAKSHTKLLISLPNIASWTARKQLFFKGDFEYQDSGLLDKTHLHFYTVNTLPKMLAKNGWQVERVIGTITRLPFENFIGKIPLLRQKLVEKYKNLSYYHFLTIAHK
ncbi:class I SAM-dependent methyltransferase [Candidatus Daviesbacteria bacterium]|nr:class I SAM-dependent methyltransferase [Candidatus Daviesbacteria bacterium]